MTKYRCLVQINGNTAEFAIDEPQSYKMICTKLAVERFVHVDCFFPDAIVTYLGMLRFSISLDGVVVGDAFITFPKEGT